MSDATPAPRPPDEAWMRGETWYEQWNGMLMDDPESTYAGSGAKCMMPSPYGTGWVCTRHAGHPGHHVAHGVGNTDMIARWGLNLGLGVEEGL